MGELGLGLLFDLGEREHLQPYEKRFCGSDVQLFGVELVEGSAEVRKTGGKAQPFAVGPHMVRIKAERSLKLRVLTAVAE